MRTPFTLILVALAAGVLAQENKPVPKDSMRVFVPGCSKGYIFTTDRRAEDESRSPIPDGMHLRMNGPKKLMADIKAHEGTRIEITGLMKKGQLRPDGVAIGGGIRVGPGPAGGSMSSSPNVSQSMIDVEGWRQLGGDCPSR
jgi:hypothetical protein